MRPALLLAASLVVALAAGCGEAAPTKAEPAPSRSASPSASPSFAKPDTTHAPSKAPSIVVPPELKGGADPDREILGGDVSWPQCPKGMGIEHKQGFGAPMPLPAARYVVLGLTNGPGFHPNPCLADQVRWVKERHLWAAAYSVVSHPSAAQLRTYGARGPYDAGTTTGRLQNAGYQQAVFNLATMRRVGLTSPIVWIDVEPVPYYDWPDTPAANARVVEGAARGYRDAGLTIGVYSTPALWERVVGDLRLGVPEWRAAGETSRAEARRRCGADWMIQGGVGVLSQWVEQGRDQNVTCAGTGAQMDAWFHRY